MKGMDCHSQDAQQTEFALQELQDMTLDPTLDQCCRRDIESQIRSERIRHSLQQHDRVDTRQRLLSSAICRDADRLANLPVGGDSTASRAAGGEQIQQRSQVEQELHELRRQRLQQLQAQSAERQQQQQDGFGRLNVVQEGNLLVR